MPVRFRSLSLSLSLPPSPCENMWNITTITSFNITQFSIIVQPSLQHQWTKTNKQTHMLQPRHVTVESTALHLRPQPLWSEILASPNQYLPASPQGVSAAAGRGAERNWKKKRWAFETANEPNIAFRCFQANIEIAGARSSLKAGGFLTLGYPNSWMVCLHGKSY